MLTLSYVFVVITHVNDMTLIGVIRRQRTTENVTTEIETEIDELIREGKIH